MLIPWKNLSPAAKVWIYQANKTLSPEICDYISTQTAYFLENWTSHQQSIRAAYQVAHQRFLILCAEPTNNLPSGCAIDASVNFVRQIGQETGTDFLDRTQIAFLRNESLQTYPLKSLAEKVSKGLIKPDTKLFDNSITTKEKLDSKWLVPAQKTWMKRYFKQ